MTGGSTGRALIAAVSRPRAPGCRSRPRGPACSEARVPHRATPRQDHAAEQRTREPAGRSGRRRSPDRLRRPCRNRLNRSRLLRPTRGACDSAALDPRRDRLDGRRQHVAARPSCWPSQDWRPEIAEATGEREDHEVPQRVAYPPISTVSGRRIARRSGPRRRPTPPASAAGPPPPGPAPRRRIRSAGRTRR